MWTGSVVSQSATKATMLSAQLDQLNAGKTDAVKNLLDSQLDGEIVTLGTLIDWTQPDKTDLAAIRILQRIADQRKGSGHRNEDSAISAILDTIYEKAKSCRVQNHQKP
jgi:hypothetical protein